MNNLHRIFTSWGKRSLFSFIGLCLFISAWAFFVSTGYCDIANFTSYVQYNNLALEDTKTGPYSNTVNGTYTVPVLNITKYGINRRLYPSGSNWFDTQPINAVATDTIEYRVTWSQAGVGAPADTVTLIDVLPGGVTFIDSQIISGGGTLTYSVGTINWINNNVPVGNSGEIRYRVRVN
jgi:uncharacterized repeat protein (TIGR01451 family)